MNRAYILGITFIVAFCSIIYELIFSQLLTVGFGSTVERYSTTIGLFLFSLGLGALLYSRWEDHLDEQKRYICFLLVEISISIIGIFGFLFVLWFSQAHAEFFISSAGQFIALSLCHIPIILVGILSGVEIPLLTRLLGVQTFATVLGVDYIGSLVGSVIYAFILYPYLGLYTATLLVVVINLGILLAFLYKIRRQITKKLFLIFHSLSVFILIVFGVLYVIEDDIYKEYLGGILRKSYYLYRNIPTPDFKLLSYKRTKYTNIMYYGFKMGNNDYYCVNLDFHLQSCNHWVHEYHQGLVDTPLSFFNVEERVKVLIIGGGDYIAAKYLEKYGDKIQSVDQVDIDKEFLEFTKKDSFFSKYNGMAYANKKLNVINSDGYNYLKNTHKKYSLILMDLPGFYTDKIAHLYSIEFFKAAHKALYKDGLLVTWVHKRDNGEQRKILGSTIATAGFKYHVNYASYKEQVDTKGESKLRFIVDHYMIAGKVAQRKFRRYTSHSKRLNDLYERTLAWKRSKIEAKPHGILIPNYAMTIKPSYTGYIDLVPVLPKFPD